MEAVCVSGKLVHVANRQQIKTRNSLLFPPEYYDVVRQGTSLWAAAPLCFRGSGPGQEGYTDRGVRDFPYLSIYPVTLISYM